MPTATPFVYSEHCDPLDVQCLKCAKNKVIGVIRSGQLLFKTFKNHLDNFFLDGINFDPLMTSTKNTKLLELTNNLRINGQLVEDCANGLLTDINANKWSD